VTATQPSTRARSLKRDTLSIAGSVAMCMAFMGPATRIAFNTNPAAAGAGFTLPLAILPAIAAVLMLLPVYGQLWPVPAGPNNLASYLVLAWLIVGASYLLFLRARRPELVHAMGRVFENDPTPEKGTP